MKTLDLLTTLEVAQRLGLSEDRVRQLADRGRLRAVRVGKTGIRLFSPDDVDRVARERAEQRRSE